MTAADSVGGDASPRLFLALRLPDPVLDALETWGAEELPDCRRLGREQLHVTLAFLGRRPESDVPAIVEALAAAAGSVEAFPLAPLRWRETAAVGMVVLSDPTGRASLLADALQDRLEGLDLYRRERRPWLPHVTVARFRVRPRLDPPLPPVRTFVPSDAAAYLSELHRSGARYTLLHTVPLGHTDSVGAAKHEEGRAGQVDDNGSMRRMDG
jgi:2'-5' RNA ligase